ncbi:MAG TPA: hypothetical protein VJK03_01830 [Candidatus Nanoarchaeia archaeon]|nr:hypothetical protein [Candidatus Nanoarchaeia archaeon]
MTLEYGSVSNIPLSMQKIGIDRRGVYVGINGRGEHVVLNKNLSYIRAIIGASCKIINKHEESFFEFSSQKERYLELEERSLAEAILSRRLA